MADGVRIANYQRPVELLEIAERGNQAQKAGKPSGETFQGR